MKIIIEAEDRGTTGRKVDMIFTTLGVEAYVTIEVDGHQYEVGWREFCKATEAVRRDGSNT